MKRRIVVAVAALALLGLPLVKAGQAEVRVNVNVPLPPLPVISLPAPPEFLMPPSLGFYVAVDVPHDIVLIGSTYYLYQDDRWYAGRHYDGPWRHVERRQLPPGLRKHKFERIRHYRDVEYRRYRADHDHYRGRHFKPEKEWKEERKQERREDKERRKEDKRYEKEERKHDKGEGRGHGKHGGRDD